MKALLMPVVLIVITVVIFMVLRRKDYSRPKECEATITAKERQGDRLIFTFTLKEGGTVVCQTREPYYDKLETGWHGMLARNGKTLVDFERFGRN